MDQTSHTSIGDIDVVAIAPYINLVVWFENVNGTFLSQQIVSNTLLRPNHTQVVDVDGDSFLDVIVSGGLDEVIYWYRNIDGDGTFSTPNIVANQSNNGRKFIAQDFDGDGDVDVAMNSSGDESLSWVENIDSQGTFNLPISLNDDFFATNDVKSGDIDGDGDNDLVTVASGLEELAWYKNLDGQGNFSDKIIISVGDSDCSRLSLGDIDNDSDIDILTSYLFISELILLYNNEDGLGNFGVATLVTDEVEGTTSIKLSDLDNDGDLDLMSSSQVDDKVAWYENRTILNVEEQSLEALSIYPNPTSGVLNLKTSKNQDVQRVQCFNIQGNLLFTSKNSDVINVSALANGMYLLKIEVGDVVVVRKFVKE
jgi:hypothetical protein